jgi:hypothetical protein
MMAPIMIMGVKKPAGIRTVVPTVVSIQRISSVANRPPVISGGSQNGESTYKAQPTNNTAYRTYTDNCSPRSTRVPFQR